MIQTVQWLLPLAALCWALSGNAQSEKIRDIDTFFRSIDEDSSMNKVTLSKAEFLGEDEHGGASMTAYFKGDTLCKICTRVGLSYAAFQEYYYFDGGKLVFAYEVENDYPEKKDGGGLDYHKPVWAFEGRYYFDGYKAFSVLTKGKRRMVEDEVHHPLELYHNANYYYEVALRKKKSGHV
jgi:hypothetical protein